MYINKIFNNRKLYVLTLIIVFILIHSISYVNFHLFHNIVELFGIIIIFSIFVISLNTYPYSNNDYFLFLGIIYLHVGILIFLHTLAYGQWNIFYIENDNLSAQIWIATRFLESISLAISFRYIKRKINVKRVIALYSLINMIIILSLFYFKIFPTGYSNNSMILFNKISELLIILILCYGLYMLQIYKSYIHSQVYVYLFHAFIFSISVDLVLIFSIDIYGLANRVGHYFRFLSFYMLYKAFIEIGLKEPNKLLFYKINQAQLELKEYNSKLIRLNKIEKLLSKSNNALINIKSLNHLFNIICEMLVEDCGYKLAWIGMVETDPDKTITPIVCIGNGCDYVMKVKFSWGNNYYGNGPVGKAARSGFYQFACVNEYEQNIPWKYFARKNSLLYGASFPIKNEDRSIAVLNLYFNDKNAFSEGDINLLLQLTKNLSYGIELVNAKNERVRNESLLKESEEKFRSLFNNTNDIIFLYSINDFSILEANNTAFEILKYKKEEINEMKIFSIMTYNNDEEKDKICNLLCKDNSTFEQELYVHNMNKIPVEITISTFRFNNNNVGLASIRDITDRKKSEEKLMFLSYHDILTGLYNRRYFELKLHEYYNNNYSDIALIVCDIDGLKEINDRFGHLRGDELIKTAAAIISKSFTAGIASRIGGDEFTILLKETSKEEVEDICKVVRNNMKEFIIENEVCILNISVGYSYNKGVFKGNIEDIYKEADFNMYQNKKQNKDNKERSFY